MSSGFTDRLSWSKLTDEQRREAVQEAARVKAQRDLLYFTRWTHPNYQPGWVHADICQRLERFSQAVAAKESPRLILCLPPRHGKSTILCQRFPVWHLGQNRGHVCADVGYGGAVAEQAFEFVGEFEASVRQIQGVVEQIAAMAVQPI